MTTTVSLYRKQGEQFTDNSGNRLIAGNVYYYQAGTNTLATTYSDNAGVNANANPIPLNGDGRLTVPVYIGPSYNYKELVTDSSLNTIAPWPQDNIPAAVNPNSGQTGYSLVLMPTLFHTSAGSPYTLAIANAGYMIEADTSGGNVTENLPSAAAVGDGKFYWFKKTAAANNLNIVPNGTDTIDGATGTFAITAQNQATGLKSDGAGWQVATNVQIASTDTPKGRLTLTTGVPVLASDVTAAGTVYYTAYNGNVIPVWNGSSFTVLSYAADLSLTLTTAASSNSIVDVFGINQNGPVIAFGPTWASATAGSSSRGTGAGTTELQLKNGVWTNKNAITLTNGATVYTGVAANQATYLGSILIDAAAGQVSCHVTFGQSRKWGVWNAYNRKAIVLLAGDGTASWTYATNTYRSSNNAAGNSASVFAGLAEERMALEFSQSLSGTSILPSIAIGWNSTTAASGLTGTTAATFSGGWELRAIYYPAPSIGLNTVNCIEKTAAGTVTFNGTNADMQLLCSYMG